MCAIGLSVNFTILRRASVVVPDAQFPALFPLQSAICCVIALVCGAKPGALLTADIPWIALQGCCVLPISFVALTVGPKYISAAEVTTHTILQCIVTSRDS